MAEKTGTNVRTPEKSSPAAAAASSPSAAQPTEAASTGIPAEGTETESAAAAQAKQEAEAKAAAQAKAERAEAFEEASQRQDAMINSAIGDVLKEATKPSKQTDPSKQIQAEINSQLEKALKGAGGKDKS